MDLILTFTLIVAHQLLSLQCKPLSDLSNEDNIISSETDAAIVDLLKDWNRQSKINTKLGQVGIENTRRNNILHMIQVIHKDGSRAPLAIILTPADLNNNKQNKHNLNENKQNHEEEVNKEIKFIETAIDMNSENNEKIQEIQKEFNLHDVETEVVPLEMSIHEEFIYNQTVQNTNTSVHNLDAITQEEITRAENTSDSKLFYDGVDYDLLSKPIQQESYQILSNEEVYDNNYYEKEDEYETDGNSQIDNESNTKNVEESGETKMPVTLKRVKNKNSTSDEEAIPAENVSNDNVRNNTIADILLGEILISNDLESKSNNTGLPKITVNSEENKNNKIGCEKEPYIKEKDSKLDTRTYNLSFVFNK